MKIKVTKTCSYAQSQPHLPHIHTYKGDVIESGTKYPEYILARAVKLENAVLVDGETLVDEDIETNQGEIPLVEPEQEEPKTQKRKFSRKGK